MNKLLYPAFAVFALFVCFAVSSNISAQSFGKAEKILQYSPAKLLDTVVDLYGHKYTLGEIAINDEMRNAASDHRTATSVSSCSSGYFQMYLEAGSGMEGTDPNSIARLNVLCQVLRDISGLISSPCATTGQKINIWVRNMHSLGGSFLGVATSFYNVPYSTSASGIADNTIWITANSGVDAYTNVTTPLAMAGGTSSYGASYYHGLMAFLCDSTILWHTDLTTPPQAGEYDLYTVALHEMMHALGFASLVDYNGASRLGSGFNYYNRYDQHLKTPAGTNLITNATPSCDAYNWNFNSALTPFSVLSPGGTSATCPSGYQSGPYVNHTVCTDAVKYVGSTTQPVYTPSCYERGSSLSHFEDECWAPSGFPLMPPASNDQYFLMCNASRLGLYSPSTNPGAMKRYPSPEERQVLCDIGYKVNTVFGSAADLNYKDYGGSACGEQVAGINDGITAGGTFSFYAAAIPVMINGGSAGSFLSNDYGAVSFKCLEVLTSGGTVSVTSGTSSTVVYFTPASGAFGIQLLRYIPVSASGVEGNITYVYVSVGDGTCTPSACDLVNNGSFEDFMGAGCQNTDISLVLHCWAPYIQSPDLFGRNPSCYPIDIPATEPFTTATDVHPFSTLPNDHFTGYIGGKVSATDYGIEASQSRLTSPIIPGNTYVISFWAIMGDRGMFLPLPATFQVALSPSSSLLPYYPASTVTGLPSGLTSFCTVPIDHPLEWHYYTRTVTYAGPAANTLVLLNATYLNPTTWGATYSTYMVIDDISIKPVNSICHFTLPDTMCFSNGLINLNDRVSVRGGTFSWTKMVGGSPVTTHDTLFDPVAAYNATTSGHYPGAVMVCYDYTDLLGCTQKICATTQIKTTLFTTAATPAAACPGATVSLACSGSPAFVYSWLPSVSCTSAPCSAATATPTVTTTYTVTETASHCPSFVTVTIMERSDIIGPAALCIGQGVSLTNLVPGGTWSSSNTTIAAITATGAVNGLTPGNVTITYTNPCGDISVKPVIVSPAPSAITGSTLVNISAVTVLADADPGGNWTSNDATIASIDPTTGSLTGIATGTVTITYTLPSGCFTTSIVQVKSILGTAALQDNARSFAIAPNPSKGILTISGTCQSGFANTEVMIEIVDLFGRSMLSDVAYFNNGNFSKQIYLTGEMANGIYLVKLTTGDSARIVQFVLLR